MFKAIAIYTFVILATSSVVFISSSPFAHLPSLYRLSKNAAVTKGKIVEKLPNERGGTVRYRFTVSSNQYEGKDWIQNFQSCQVGDGVEVRYDPENPNVSMLSGNPEDNFKATTFLLGLFSLFVGLVFGLPLATIMMFKLRKN